MRQADRSLAGVKIGKSVRKGLGGLPAGMEADVLLRRGKLDDVPPFKPEFEITEIIGIRR